MEALVEYYEKERDNIVRRMARRAGGPENAEDVVQEAFARAVKFYHSYDPERPFEGWFVRILNNSLREFQIAERNYGMALNDAITTEDEPAAEDKLDGMYRDEAEELIDRYPEQDAEILRLYFLSGYKTGEVVQMLDEKYRRVLYVVSLFKTELKERYGR